MKINKVILPGFKHYSIAISHHLGIVSVSWPLKHWWVITIGFHKIGIQFSHSGIALCLFNKWIGWTVTFPENTNAPANWWTRRLIIS